MVKMNMSDIDISEPLSDMLAPLNNEQKEFLMNNYTIQTYKKNETIYCEGETPSHLMCLINGKVKIFKDGVGGRSQIIRMIKLILPKRILLLPQQLSNLLLFA